MSHIQLEVDLRLDKDGEPVVTLRTVDGRQASLCVEMPLGAPGNPLADEALDEKFFSLTTRVMPQERAAELLKQLRRMEDLESIRTLERWLG